MPILGNGLLKRGQTWSQYVTGLAPVAWYRLRETSGTNAANSGSGGSALDMTITSATLAQTGKLGPNEAHLMDGANTRYQTANNAALANLTTWEYVFLVNPSSAGEGNIGGFFVWGNQTNEPCLIYGGSLNALTVRVANTTPTNFDSTTTTGLSASTWALIFVAFDNAGDRKVHVYKGVSGSVSEYAYSAQPAMTGTYRTPTNPLNLFNNTAQSETFAGLGDEAMIFNGNLSAAQRTRLCLLAGV